MGTDGTVNSSKDRFPEDRPQLVDAEQSSGSPTERTESPHHFEVPAPMSEHEEETETGGVHIKPDLDENRHEDQAHQDSKNAILGSAGQIYSSESEASAKASMVEGQEKKDQNKTREVAPSTGNVQAKGITGEESADSRVGEQGMTSGKYAGSVATADHGTAQDNPAGSEPSLNTSQHQGLPVGYSIRKLELELTLQNTEKISCIASHEANLYIGTSMGRLLHLHLFEDAQQYILIYSSSVHDSEKAPVSKILALPDAEICLVLVNKVVYPFSFPELSPSRVGKIKDAQDISILKEGKSPTKTNKSDKVIVYTSSCLRVVQFLKSSVKLLRDINYSGALLGRSSASGTSAHYSNICLVANDRRYDVVDMQQTRKIPLFDYNPMAISGVLPLIAPFTAMDHLKHAEQYLLPICSDELTSMAMFINSSGDVARGTLTWIGYGYPRGGLTIEWPFVIGIFATSSNSSQCLIFSSLESLDVTSVVDSSFLARECGCSETLPLKLLATENAVKSPDTDLSKMLTKVSCVDSQAVALPKVEFEAAHTIISSGDSLFFLHKEPEIMTKLNTLLESSDEISHESFLSSHLHYFELSMAKDQFHHDVHLVLMLMGGNVIELEKIVREQHSETLRIDPRLLLYFSVTEIDPTDRIWIEFTTQNFFIEFKRRIANDIILQNVEFRRWLILEIFAQQDQYESVVSATFRKLAYVMACDTSAEILHVLEKEKHSWLGQNLVNDELIGYFEINHYYFVLLHIYILKQKAGNPFDKWSQKIIDLALELLSGKKTNNSADVVTQTDTSFVIGDFAFDLVDLAFSELKQNIDDEAFYTKKLLELLQLSPERGLSLLNKFKGGKYRATHKFILSELSKSYDFGIQFLSMKMEYVESSFMDLLSKEENLDLNLVKELLNEYIMFLSQDDLSVENENLSILFNTYSVENDLKDSNWPKLTWIEYLHLNYKRNNCDEYFQSYMKTYEVMILLTCNDQGLRPVLESENKAILFLNKVFEKSQERLSYLLEMGDFSTVEWLISHDIPPVPRQSFLLEPLKKNQQLKFALLPSHEAKERLNTLLTYYLALEDKMARNATVMHLIEHYGRQYLGFKEVLLLLPDDYPISFMQKFIISEILELESIKTDANMRKQLAKADARGKRIVAEEFEQTFSKLIRGENSP